MKECPACGLCIEDIEEKCPEDGSVPTASFEGSGLIADKYRLVRRLGQGGMGIVYRAIHRHLQKEFAVKLILPRRAHNSEFLQRFRVEAEALGRLNHPSIVSVTDFGIDEPMGGIPYLVMELVRGEQLSAILAKGALPIERALSILRSIAQAVDHAHRAGVIHRDLKPENIILAKGLTGDDEIKVLDFGLARLMDESPAVDGAGGSDARPNPREQLPIMQDPSTTIPGLVVGTPAYVAPETLKAKGGAPADIYSLGVMAYQMLAGRTPFIGHPEEILEQHLNDEPPSPSAVNPNLPTMMDKALLKSMEKDPTLRPQHAMDIISGLRDAYRKARMETWKQTERPRRFRAAIILAVAVLIPCALLEQSSSVRLFENKVVDTWVWLAPPKPLNSKIIMVIIPENFWNPLRSSDADAFAAVLQQLFDSGAGGIAIDLILPERFQASGEFARWVILHHERIVLSAVTIQSGSLRGPECIGGMVTAAIGPEKAARLFSHVSLDEDPDGKVRRYPVAFRDAHGRQWPSLALKAARLGDASNKANSGEILIDYLFDWRKNVIEWAEIPKLLQTDPRFFYGAIVIVGAKSDFDEDIHLVPHSRTMPDHIPGIAIHSLALAIMLGSRRIEHIALLPQLLLLGLLLIIIAIMFLWIRRPGTIIMITVLIAIIYVMAAFAFFTWKGGILTVMMPLLGILIVAVSARMIDLQLAPPPFQGATND